MKPFFLRTVASAALLLSVAGCWTFNESEYPQVEMTPIAMAATNATIAVTGFKSVFVDYNTVSGYSTVYVPGWYNRYHYMPGHFETVNTVTYVPVARNSDAFLVRAKELFEQAGFAFANTPRYTVEVRFEGPATTSSDMNRTLAWMLCTVFFCDYSAQSWTARLSVRDNTTGKLLLGRDYVQRYEANVFSLIPLFGPASCPDTSHSHMQAWCLSALTERTVADATAFLSSLN